MKTGKVVLIGLLTLVIIFALGRLARTNSPRGFSVTRSDLVQSSRGFFDGIMGTGRMTGMKRHLILSGWSEKTADFVDISNPSPFEIVGLVIIASAVCIVVRRHKRNASQ